MSAGVEVLTILSFTDIDSRTLCPKYLVHAFSGPGDMTDPTPIDIPSDFCVFHHLQVFSSLNVEKRFNSSGEHVLRISTRYNLKETNGTPSQDTQPVALRLPQVWGSRKGAAMAARNFGI